MQTGPVLNSKQGSQFNFGIQVWDYSMKPQRMSWLFTVTPAVSTMTNHQPDRQHVIYRGPCRSPEAAWRHRFPFCCAWHLVPEQGSPQAQPWTQQRSSPTPLWKLPVFSRCHQGKHLNNTPLTSVECWPWKKITAAPPTKGKLKEKLIWLRAGQYSDILSISWYETRYRLRFWIL